MEKRKKKNKAVAFATTFALAGAASAAIGATAGVIPDRLLGYMLLTFGLIGNYYAASAVCSRLPDTWAVQLPAGPAAICGSIAATYGGYQAVLALQ